MLRGSLAPEKLCLQSTTLASFLLSAGMIGSKRFQLKWIRVVVTICVWTDQQKWKSTLSMTQPSDGLPVHLNQKHSLSRQNSMVQAVRTCPRGLQFVPEGKRTLAPSTEDTQPICKRLMDRRGREVAKRGKGGSPIPPLPHDRPISHQNPHYRAEWDIRTRCRSP